MQRLNKSEVIFKVISYVLLGALAIVALYPVIYAFSASISGKMAYESGRVILWPVDINFQVYELLFNDKGFWNTYINTLFYAIFGTAASMIVTTIGAYALAKRKLLFRRQFNFMIVFTMWFSAGIIPQYINFNQLGVTNQWGILYGFIGSAFNTILLRNAFEGIPEEIEEAALMDGVTEFQMMAKVFIPMSKSAIATVALFFATSRWNGYIWQRLLLRDVNEQNVQVYMRVLIENYQSMIENSPVQLPYAADSYVYAILVCSIIPVIFIYPHIQKYFVKGINLGGVKG